MFAEPPKAKPFERFDDCLLEPDKWTDGDSFRVRLPDGRRETFRLYFVDTTESRKHTARSVEQAAYFGITTAEAIELGKGASDFTHRALEKPFTIYTRWRTVLGSPRYYALVMTAYERDLNQLLVSAGLARIYGTRTPSPNGTNSRAYLAHLAELEMQAKAARRGGWGKGQHPRCVHGSAQGDHQRQP